MHAARRGSRVLVGLASALIFGCASQPEGANPGPAEERPGSVGVLEAELVGQITGPEGWTDTQSWGVHGTDLGHTFWHGDDLYMVFGDTFGDGGFGGEDWRSNTIAQVDMPDSDLQRSGVRISNMVSRPDGTARELLPSMKREGEEITVIPTYGISVNGRMYLHYMSVVRWHGGTGRWDVGHSGFAFSEDDGHTWTAPDYAVRPGDTGFEQVAMVEKDGFVYIFGIPEGRFGGVRLARVEPEELLNLSAHEYWTGERWSSRLQDATTVVPPAVGELSVAWNEAHQAWMMMYLNLERGAVVLRTAPELVGPWGSEEVVFTAEEHPGLYAPYLLHLSEMGEEIYFTMSLWGPYNVFLARMVLEDRPRIAENDPTGPSATP